MTDAHAPPDAILPAPRLRDYIDRSGAFGTRGYDGLTFRCEQLFAHTDGVSGRRILEIGGGEGLFLQWTLAHGAVAAANVEPVAAGSFANARDQFEAHRRALGLPPEVFTFYPHRIQEFDGRGGPYDILLSYSSINHLDEEACQELERSESARQVYTEIFRQLHGLLAPGGFLIIHDAGRINYWNLLGLRSPFCPSIEWHKHQEARTWTELAGAAGFRPVAREWISFHRLRNAGPLARSGLVARATLSQFILTLRRGE